MTRKTLSPSFWAVRSATALFVLSAAFPAWSQEEPPAPEATESEAAPADDAAETPEVIPVETGEAETPPAADATELDTIQVTGSRLKRTDYESAQPVLSISREDIERTGLTDISQILRHLTVAGNNSLSAQQGRFALSLGEVNLDLRNLGASHTLLLVNGRRWVTGLVPTQPSVSDYNTIPTAIIERIEILKDGASAIYGSDAIGGVVNIITRKDYEGAGLSYQLGQFVREGDGVNQQAIVNWGMTRPGSSLFLNLSYTDQGRAPNEARALTASPASGIVRQSAVTTRGTVILINPTQNNSSFYGCPAAIGATEQLPASPPVGPSQVGAGVTLCTLQRNVGATDGSSTQTDWHQGARTDPGASPDDVFNRFGEGSLTEPNTRTAMYMQYARDLGNQLNFDFDALYNVRKSTSVGQRGYMGGGDRLFLGSESYLAYIPASDSENPFGQDIGRDGSCADQSDPTCQHLGTGTGLWAIRLGGTQDNQNFNDEVDTLRLGGSLKSDFDILGLPVSWDGGYIFARNKIQELYPNARFDFLAQALENGEGPPCTAPCVPLDVLFGRNAITQAAVDFVFYDAWQRNRNRQDIIYFDLSSELPFVPLLAGPVAVATGVEFRRDEYESRADPVLQQGLVFLNKLRDTRGKTYSREAYLELGLPLLKDLPMVQELDLNLAARHSRYPTFGDVTTGKAGVRWKPLDDLLLRGTYSTGFRAPNIGELYNGPNQSFDGITDPCVNGEAPNSTTNQNCTTDGASGGGTGQVGVLQPYDLWTGNPDLKPERSKNLTYGLVYSPRWVPDLNFTLDFYDIEITDYITIGGGVGQYFLDSCYKSPRPTGAPANSGPHCDKVNRDSGGTLVFVDTPWFNLAAVETSGIDAGIDYVLPVPARFGRFKFAVEASYLKQFDSITPQVGGLPNVADLVGTDSGQFSGYPEWKAGSVLSWTGDLYKASWSTRMAYEMTEPCGDFFDALQSVASLGLCSHPVPAVADDPATPADESRPDMSTNLMKTVFYHNVQISRALPSYDAAITFGVNNVLDQDPPLSRSNIGIFWYNYDPNHYEAPGRFGYLKAEFKF